MKLIIFFLLGLLNGLPIQESNDSVYYAKVTNVRNYMDQDRTTVTEIWRTKDKSCTLINQRKSILRNDLGLIYLINLQAETYTVDSIKTRPTQAPAKKGLDFKYIGQDYTPVYEWKKPLLVNKDTIGKYSCDHFLCRGDADFDQILLDYFLIKTDDKSLAGIINSFLLSSGSSANKREPLTQAVNKDNNLLILKIIERVENPIAPPIITTITVDTFTKLQPEMELFEVPINFRQNK